MLPVLTSLPIVSSENADSSHVSWLFGGQQQKGVRHGSSDGIKHRTAHYITITIHRPFCQTDTASSNAMGVTEAEDGPDPGNVAGCECLQQLGLGLAGRRIGNFPRPGSLANYWGLTPGCRNSGDATDRLGTITGSPRASFLRGEIDGVAAAAGMGPPSPGRVGTSQPTGPAARCQMPATPVPNVVVGDFRHGGLPVWGKQAF